MSSEDSEANDDQSDSSSVESNYATYKGAYEPYEDEPLADPCQSGINESRNADEEPDIDGLTASTLEKRYEKTVTVDSW